MSELMQERIEIASLIMAALVVIVALYRYILTRWRSDVDLRSYPFLKLINGRKWSGVVQLGVDCPTEQQLSVDLLDSTEQPLQSVFAGRMDVGFHQFEVDTAPLAEGTYYIQLKSLGQVDTRRVEVVR